MTIDHVTQILEELAPLPHAEDFDNVGLLVGNGKTAVSGILVTLDTLENVVDEAIKKNCNLIVSFHPIIFKGLKKLNGKSYVERVVLNAIKNDIAIYSMHTALDNAPLGVNHKICEALGLENPRILIPKKGEIKKLVTYVPINKRESLSEALFEAGAGNIGNYSHCSFATEGMGSFRPEENSSPTIGERGKTHFEPEVQLNITYPVHLESGIMKALFKNHPYEEVAYEITTLDNQHQQLGMGMIGSLKEPMQARDFLEFVKGKMNSGVIRHSNILEKPIKNVAVLGGSGAFAIPHAIRQKADVLVTSDLKYHDFFSAEGKILLADIGHYESEQFTKNLLVDYLKQKIPNFAINLSESITNPVHYL